MKNKVLSVLMLGALSVSSASYSMDVVAKISEIALTLLDLTAKVSLATEKSKTLGAAFEASVKEAKDAIELAKSNEGKSIEQLTDISAALVKIKEAKVEEMALLTIVVDIMKTLTDKVITPTITLANKTKNDPKIAKMSADLSAFVANISNRMKTGKELLADIESLADEVNNAAATAEKMQSELNRCKKGGAARPAAKPAASEDFAF